MGEWWTLPRWVCAMGVLLVVFGSLHALREQFGPVVDRVFWSLTLAIVMLGVGFAFGIEVWLALRADW